MGPAARPGRRPWRPLRREPRRGQPARPGSPSATPSPAPTRPGARWGTGKGSSGVSRYASCEQKRAWPALEIADQAPEPFREAPVMTSLAAVHWNARPGVASACMHITGADAVGAAERAGQLASDPAMATCGSCRRAARAAGHSLPPAPPQSPRPPGRDRTAERRALRLMQVAVFAWYGETCSCCGTTENLSVDHAAGNGPEHRTEVYGYPGTRGYNPAKLYRWIIEHQFPADLGTMCRPCNWSKRDGDHCRLFHGPALAARQKWCGGCERVRDRQTHFGPDARRADKLSDTAGNAPAGIRLTGGNVTGRSGRYRPGREQPAGASLRTWPGTASLSIPRSSPARGSRLTRCHPTWSVC